MIPPTFEAAIANIFKEKSTETLVLQDEPNNALSRIEETGNIEVLYFDGIEVLNRTFTEITEGTILLTDLIRNRQEIYHVAKRISDLEMKEEQDIIKLQENMQWHEKSNFVRLFIKSDKSDQLDQEKEDAKIAKSITGQFTDKFTGFESFLDEHILHTGTKYDDDFLSLVYEWSELSKLKDSLLSARENIRQGQSKLKNNISCGESSCRVNNSESNKHFSLAIIRLTEQINIFKPRAEQLTEKVESAILRVRTQLLLN